MRFGRRLGWGQFPSGGGKFQGVWRLGVQPGLEIHEGGRAMLVSGAGTLAGSQSPRNALAICRVVGAGAGQVEGGTCYLQHPRRKWVSTGPLRVGSAHKNWQQNRQRAFQPDRKNSIDCTGTMKCEVVYNTYFIQFSQQLCGVSNTFPFYRWGSRAREDTLAVQSCSAGNDGLGFEPRPVVLTTGS